MSEYATRWFACLIACTSALFLSPLSLGAKEPQPPIQITEINGAVTSDLKVLPSSIVATVKTSGEIPRYGLLVAPTSKIPTDRSMLDENGEWRPIHQNKADMMVPKTNTHELTIGPLTIPGEPGIQTFLVQAIAERDDGSLSYSEPRAIRIHFYEKELTKKLAATAKKRSGFMDFPSGLPDTPGGLPPGFPDELRPDMPQPDADAPLPEIDTDDDEDWIRPGTDKKGQSHPLDGKPVPISPAVCGDWQGIEIYPKRKFEKAVVVGRSLFGVLDKNVIVEIDLDTMQQTRSLKLPRAISRFQKAGDTLALLLESPAQLITLDPASLKPKWTKDLAAEYDVEERNRTFFVARHAPVVCMLDEKGAKLLRIDLTTKRMQEWTWQQINYSGIRSDGTKNPFRLRFNSGIALSNDGESFFMISSSRFLHRIRFAGGRLEVEESSPVIGHIQNAVRILGDQGIVALRISGHRISRSLFNPDDLNAPIGSLSAVSHAIAVDDARGLVIAGSGAYNLDRLTVFRGGLLADAAIGYPIAGDPIGRERHLWRGTIDPDQILFLGPEERRVFAGDLEHSYIVTPPDWLFEPVAGTQPKSN